MIETYPIEKELQRNPEMKMSDIEILREWSEKQQHLPKIPESWLALFLHSNFYRIEPSKTTIENHFTVRTHVPEFFASRDPLGSKGLRRAFTVAATIEMPMLTKQNYRIMYSRFIDTDASHYDFNECTKHFFMVMDLWLFLKGAIDGYVYVADGTGLTIGHAGRLSPLGLKKFLFYIQEAAPIRLKGVHIINAPPAAEIVFGMMKPFMKKELLHMIHFHSKLSDLEEFGIPVESLPNESGGKAGTLMELQKEQIKKLEERRHWFLQEEQCRVNESLRVGKGKTAGDLFGVEGSFKKLDID